MYFVDTKVHYTSFQKVVHCHSMKIRVSFFVFFGHFLISKLRKAMKQYSPSFCRPAQDELRQLRSQQQELYMPPSEFKREISDAMEVRERYMMEGPYRDVGVDVGWT